MLNKFGIATKLALLTLIGAGCILMLIVGYGYVRSRDMLRSEMQERVQQLAAATSYSISRIPLSVEIVADSVAVSLKKFNPSPDEIYDFLEKTMEANPAVGGICVGFSTDLKDKELSTKAPFVYRDDNGIHKKDLGSNGYDRTVWDWYQLPRQLGKAVWTEPYFGTGGSNRLLVSYCIPVYSDSGEFLATVVCDVSLDWLTEILSELEIEKGGYAFLITANGVIISHPERNFIMNETIFSLSKRVGGNQLWSLGRKMQSGKEGLALFSDFYSKESNWLYYRPVSRTGWSLGIVFPRKVLLARIHDLSRSQVLLGLSGMLLLLFVSLFIAKTITGPIRKLSASTEILAAGDFESPLPAIEGSDEVAHLAWSFALMQQSLLAYVEELQDTTAARERIESELNIAHSIQMSLVPRSFPPFPSRSEFDLFALLDPAKEVGGDFYDFFMTDENHMLIVIGDVSGKGVPAALFMAVTRTFIKAFAKEEQSPSAMLLKLNNEISMENDACMFVTLFCALIDLRDGSFVYASGGHNPIYKLSSKDVLALKRVKGPLVGPMADMYFEEGTDKLEHGEALFLYTDGVTEALNPAEELLGDDKTVELLRGFRSLDSRTMIDEMRKSIRQFADGAEQSDDVTMLCFRYFGVDETAED